jgi:hypothetical protein
VAEHVEEGRPVVGDDDQGAVDAELRQDFSTSAERIS